MSPVLGCISVSQPLDAFWSQLRAADGIRSLSAAVGGLAELRTYECDG